MASINQVAASPHAGGGAAWPLRDVRTDAVLLDGGRDMATGGGARCGCGAKRTDARLAVEPAEVGRALLVCKMLTGRPPPPPPAVLLLATLAASSATAAIVGAAAAAAAARGATLLPPPDATVPGRVPLALVAREPTGDVAADSTLADSIPSVPAVNAVLVGAPAAMAAAAARAAMAAGEKGARRWDANDDAVDLREGARSPSDGISPHLLRSSWCAPCMHR